ncbi:hypothetical protein [Sphingomonas sp.]|uniref:hypothetical protein n=1 Tax=Sphingomonas sp. TaxID=28214 RepID=UPI003F70A147
MEWAKKLVAKTHGGPQTADIIYAGVLETKGTRGEVKASALRQFNLMDGPKEAYSATDLAKKITAAPPEELTPLLKQAALFPPLFKSIFDTFHGDTFSIGKLKQRASELNVHPENVESAISIYCSSLEYAGLISVDGDKITHKSASELEFSADNEESETTSEAAEDASTEREYPDADAEDVTRGSPRAIFHVNVNLDASLDSDKLEKQLALLKRYGAI